MNLEDCSGCGLSGWGWQDNGWGVGVMGQSIYFQTTGAHKIRVQVREDGLSIDQIVLSPVTYLSASPGTLMNDTTILPKTTAPSNTRPIVTILKPNDPETLLVNAIYTITWTVDVTNLSSQTVQLSIDGGLTWQDVITNLSGGARSYAWRVPNRPTKLARIRVLAYSGGAYGEGMSGNNFTIAKKLKASHKKKQKS